MNPLEYLNKVHGITAPHITYDPNIEKEYEIVRGSSHDGTLLFTYQNIDRCLEPLVNKTSCYKLTAPENPDDVIDIKYTVGDIRFEKSLD